MTMPFRFACQNCGQLFNVSSKKIGLPNASDENGQNDENGPNDVENPGKQMKLLRRKTLPPPLKSRPIRPMRNQVTILRPNVPNDSTRLMRPKELDPVRLKSSARPRTGRERLRKSVSDQRTGYHRPPCLTKKEGSSLG